MEQQTKRVARELDEEKLTGIFVWNCVYSNDGDGGDVGNIILQCVKQSISVSKCAQRYHQSKCNTSDYNQRNTQSAIEPVKIQQITDSNFRQAIFPLDMRRYSKTTVIMMVKRVTNIQQMLKHNSKGNQNQPTSFIRFDSLFLRFICGYGQNRKVCIETHFHCLLFVRFSVREARERPLLKLSLNNQNMTLNRSSVLLLLYQFNALSKK